MEIFRQSLAGFSVVNNIMERQKAATVRAFLRVFFYYFVNYTVENVLLTAHLDYNVFYTSEVENMGSILKIGNRL